MGPRRVEGRFAGRDIIEKPTCPFCGALIERPQETTSSAGAEMPLGRCTCGAVYSFDVTGHNLGNAMINALVHACQGNWDMAWDLSPEEDYIEKQVDHYDYETHLIVHSSAFRGRRIAGTLFFIKINQATPQAEKAVSKPLPVSPRRPALLKRLTKDQVEECVRAYDLVPLLAVAEDDKKILRDLRRL